MNIIRVLYLKKAWGHNVEFHFVENGKNTLCKIKVTNTYLWQITLNKVFIYPNKPYLT